MKKQIVQGTAEMIKKKILLSFILIIILIPFIQAETNTVDIQDVFELGSIRFAKPCFFNGTYCSSAGQCNLTVFYPNNSVLLNNQIMTNSIYEHNISFVSNALGIHKADQVCKDQGFFASSTFYFDVTASGIQNTTSQSIIYIITFFGSLLLFFLFLFSAINVPVGTNRDPEGFLMGVDYWKYIRSGLWLFSYLSLIWVVNILVAITNNFLPLGIATTFFRMIYFFLLISILPLVPLVFYIFIYNVVRDKEIKSAIERGIKIT